MRRPHLPMVDMADMAGEDFHMRYITLTPNVQEETPAKEALKMAYDNGAQITLDGSPWYVLTFWHVGRQVRCLLVPAGELEVVDPARLVPE